MSHLSDASSNSQSAPGQPLMTGIDEPVSVVMPVRNE
jgi:hypothetical protein